MSDYILRFDEIDGSMIGEVGGKSANLGELSGIEGIRVPDGFCVTTAAYKNITENNRELDGLLDELSRLTAEEREEIAAISARIREVIEGVSLPKVIAEEIVRSLVPFDDDDSFAVRSSATAEDLPTASFAGQQDSFLNIIGSEEIVKHIGKCWASLFTERAVIYRMRNGFDHRTVRLAVVVQKMVFAQAAGIMFTADPVTAHRKVISIDAGFGLGEAMVSGRVNPDVYKVREGMVIDRTIATKTVEVHAMREGGTIEREIEPERRNEQVLSEDRIVELERIGRTIEKHFGTPQDIEWCLVDDAFHVVQSRPITTLFPIPEANDDGYHVYLSTGHQQMMTDAMKPMGLSFFLMTTRAPMRTAGGRLFVDVAPMLATPGGRELLLKNAGAHDPLIHDALMTIIEREGSPPPTDVAEEPSPGRSGTVSASAGSPGEIEYDPAVVPDLIANGRASIDELKRSIRTMSGSDLFDFIVEDIPRLRTILFEPPSSAVISRAMDASAWINERMREWLGHTNAADRLTQSVPNNITSEMGLALLDVADAIRPHPRVVEFLQRVDDDDFLDRLVALDGGREARDAIRTFLDRYGMRCVGEIDISRPRWSDKPTALLPLILTHVRSAEQGAGARTFEQGRRDALWTEAELLDRLKRLPDGERNADEAKRIIDLMRSTIGYREYPKYFMINRYAAYRAALLREGERLVDAGVLDEVDDLFYLTFEELREVVRTNELDKRIIDRRRNEYESYEKLTPPRVITSDGEIVRGRYKRDDLPSDALIGLAVSSGVVEGRARVITSIEDSDLDEGDIVVTRFTDPSWTPLFLSISGLVTEVGGLMTHGAVIAREYELPAVVGVEGATTLIRDGERIRVNGTEGFVELLSSAGGQQD